MQDYVVQKCESRLIDGRRYDITTFKGQHRDECLVRSNETGRCSLRYKGVVRMSWDMPKEGRDELFTVYENGKAVKSEYQTEKTESGNRYIENCKDGLRLVIKDRRVVYKGGFDNVESMRRKGKGAEYDPWDGRVLRCGVWKDDKLFQLTQEFVSEKVMIEYHTEQGREAVTVWNLRPVYQGGYVFDEEKKEYVRHGEGCELDKWTGVAVREGVWERGVLKESRELFDGWYVKRARRGVMEGELDVEDLRVEVHNWDEWKNVSKEVTDLVIPSNCCNEEGFKMFDVSELTCLKRLEIGDRCFENVRDVRLTGLKWLERVVIGEKSFTNDDIRLDSRPLGDFYLQCCGRLKEVKIGCQSFYDYTTVMIDDLPSLEVIEIGELNKVSANFDYASEFELEGEGGEMT